MDPARRRRTPKLNQESDAGSPSKKNTDAATETPTY